MYRFWLLLLALSLSFIPQANWAQQATAELADELAEELAEELVVGIFPRRNPEVTVRLFKPLQEYLEQQLGLPVRLRTAANFSSFYQQLQQRQYDLVHYNQYHYIKTGHTLGYELVAQNEEFGESTIRGALSVRRDAGIDSLQQLKGRTIVFGGGRQAMMSYIVPRYLLASAGLTAQDYRERIASNPPNAVLATYLHQADAAGCGEIALRLPVVTDKVDSNQLKLLARSEAIAHLPWAVKRELPESFKQRLSQLMLGLKHSAQGRQVLDHARLTGLNPVKDADYDPHREMINVVENAASVQPQ